MDILEDLEKRGLINQVTNLKGLRQRLKKGKIILYCGFDPTAESLHIGNLLLLITLKRFQLYGHQPIIVLGGGTGLIGDPSGKTQERKLNPEKIVKQWGRNIKAQIKVLFDFSGSNRALLLDNYYWLARLKVISFLREIGKHFTIPYLLAKESVKKRLETGISFTEFSYALLQAYDFLYLHRKYNCELQIGGSDQWGNITAGIDLIKKLTRKEVFGLTVPLVTRADGKKFGKTEKGTIWLDPRKTSPYQFYQFWINTDDKDVIKFLAYFTFLSLEEIKKLEEEIIRNPEKRVAQKTLAWKVTSLVHGEQKANQAQKISEKLFSGDIQKLSLSELKIAFQDVPSFNLTGTRKISLVDLLTQAGISSSKRQAREDICSGAITVNGKKIQNLEKEFTLSDCLFRKYLIIRRGKKNYYLISWQ